MRTASGASGSQFRSPFGSADVDLEAAVVVDVELCVVQHARRAFGEASVVRARFHRE